MSVSVPKKIAAFAFSTVLVVGGALALAGAASLSPSQAGVVDQAQAKVKTKKHTFWRNDTATWNFTINGKKITKKQLKVVKVKSSNKKVVKIKKSSKKITLYALKKGKSTLTAHYKGKLVSKYKVTVKEASKFYGSWRLVEADMSSGGIEASTAKTYIDSGVISGTFSANAKGAATLSLTYNVNGTSQTDSFPVKWYAITATRAQFGSDTVGEIIGGRLTLNVDNGDWYTFVR